MILSLLFFLGVALLLCFEGKLLLRLVARKQLTLQEQWALGFPLGAFLNALLFFVLTVFKVPLTLFAVYGAHAVIIAMLFFTSRKRPIPAQFPVFSFQFPINFQFSIFNSPFKKLLIVFLLISLSIKVFYAFSHAVLLPSYYFDTVSQWNMRARISYEDRAIAFDREETRGMSKPQYPILLHSLQILFMLPQKRWLDPIANASTFLLTLSACVALFLLFWRRGSIFALLAVALLLMVPLLAIHTGQGHGDIHVIEYLLLAAVFLTLASQRHPAVRGSDPSASSSGPRGGPSGSRRERSPERVLSGAKDESRGGVEGSSLFLSGTFVAAAAWVKQEGLFFGVVPWIALVAVGAWIGTGSDGSEGSEGNKRLLLLGFLPATLLGFLWTFFISIQGFPMGAHAGDFQLEWHSEGISKVLSVLFSFGSFGIFFYVLPVALSSIVGAAFRNRWEHIPSLLVALWGLLTFIETLFVFIATANYQYLVSHLTFHRTMLIPLTLLILGCMLLLKEGEQHSQMLPPSPRPTRSTAIGRAAAGRARLRRTGKNLRI